MFIDKQAEDSRRPCKNEKSSNAKNILNKLVTAVKNFMESAQEVFSPSFSAVAV